MKVHLLHRDRDAVTGVDETRPRLDLVRDLGLEILLEHMAQGDKYLYQVARATMLAPLTDPEQILYRQRVLRDCLDNREVLERLYSVAMDAEATPKKVRGWFLTENPAVVLSHAVNLLTALMDNLRQLRKIADSQADGFVSDGFRTFFDTVRENLDNDYLAALDGHLARLKFHNGVHATAGLDDRGRITDMVLRKQANLRRSWREVLHLEGNQELTYRLPERDEAGGRELSALRDRATNSVADAAAQSADHIISFFSSLRWELGFYAGCLALHDDLVARGLPVCLPTPVATADRRLTARELYDPGLGLRRDEVVPNDVCADDTTLVMITGANQGGKSTLLRAVACAQLMMQSGMHVPARACDASVASGLFTHFVREEDSEMEMGKLDEELARMSEIVDVVRPHSVVFFNESFASTNEREGSRIARQIVDALREAEVRVVFVTHMYDLAHGLESTGAPDMLFLCPELTEGGDRTYRILPGRPQTTSHGTDLYEQVFTAT